MLKNSKGLEDTAINECIENLNDNYDKFWYYLDQSTTPPTKLGPYTRQNMKEFMKNKVIDDCTIVWHPLIKSWKLAFHVKVLTKTKKDPSPEVIDCLEEIKRANARQPVYLKQGYLHIQSKKDKNRWKSRWVVMTSTSISLYTLPNGKLKKELKIANIDINPIMSLEKQKEITMAITDTIKNHIYVFWSPFQRETFEWIIELKKLNWLKDEAQNYIIEAECSINETNLFVSFNYN